MSVVFQSWEMFSYGEEKGRYIIVDEVVISFSRNLVGLSRKLI